MRGTAFQKGGNLLDVGEKIRYLRLKKRWTQKHLAGLLGVDKSTISQYETYMRTPSYKILVKLCYIFQVSADFFLDVHVGAESPFSLDGLTESQMFCIDGFVSDFRKANSGDLNAGTSAGRFAK